MFLGEIYTYKQTKCLNIKSQILQISSPKPFRSPDSTNSPFKGIIQIEMCFCLSSSSLTPSQSHPFQLELPHLRLSPLTNAIIFYQLLVTRQARPITFLIPNPVQKPLAGTIEPRDKPQPFRSTTQTSLPNCKPRVGSLPKMPSRHRIRNIRSRFVLVATPAQPNYSSRMRLEPCLVACM